jgi:transposase
MTHGGKRLGAGRKPTNIDEKRMMLLIGRGMLQKDIASAFGVPSHVIRERVKKLASIAAVLQPP